MPRIEVNTATVEAAAAQVKQAGATTREAAGYLAPGTIADPGFQTAQAVARFCATWSTSLGSFAKACESVSGRLSTAGKVYEITDIHLSEGF